MQLNAANLQRLITGQQYVQCRRCHSVLYLLDPAVSTRALAKQQQTRPKTSRHQQYLAGSEDSSAAAGHYGGRRPRGGRRLVVIIQLPRPSRSHQAKGLQLISQASQPGVAGTDNSHTEDYCYV